MNHSSDDSCQKLLNLLTCHFGKGQNVMTRRLGKCFSETTKLIGCSRVLSSVIFPIQARIVTIIISSAPLIIFPYCTRTRNVTSLAADSDYNVLANRCNEIITFLVSRYIKIFLLCYYLWHHILNTMEHILDASSAPKNYLPAIQENFVTCAQTSEARYLRRTQATGEPRQY